MSVTLETTAELEAAKAEAFPAFSGLKVLHIKRNVAAILRQIGASGIFESHTSTTSHILMRCSRVWIG